MPDLIKQSIPFKDKTEQWCIENVKEKVSLAKASANSKQHDIACWFLYDEKQDPTALDYLNKYGEYYLPAEVRHIGIQRPKVNYLAAKQARRSFVFSVYLADNKSIEEKYKLRTKRFVDLLSTKIKLTLLEQQKAKNAITKQRQKYQEVIAQAEQAFQQKQQNGEQVSQQDYESLEMAKAQIEDMDMQLGLLSEKIDNDMYVTKEEIDEVDRYYKYTYKDIKEEIAQKYLKYCRNKLSIQDESLRVFIDNKVTGKGFYFVDYEGGKLPTFRRENSMKIYYPIEDNVRYVQNSSWVAIEESTSMPSLIQEFGGVLTREQISKIEASQPRYTQTQLIATPENSVYFPNGNIKSVYSGSSSSIGNIKIWRVYWQSQDVLSAVISPNKYDSSLEHIHFLTDDSDKEKIKNKTYKVRENERIEQRYVNQLYQGVWIEDVDIYVKCRKHPYPLRKEDDWSYTELPVVGRSHNNITDSPYSYIWATKDIQQLYNIVHYHQFLMLAMAGTKTVIMDESQRPSNMSDEEWEYNKKMGTMYIESAKKGVRANPTIFNQFAMYDLSVSPSIQYLIGIAKNLSEINDMIWGVTPQAMGQIVPTDQVGTTNASINQSSLITEIMYYEHDFIEKQALERFMNLSAKYCLKKDQVYQFIDSSFASEIIKLHSDFDDLDFEIFIPNIVNEENKLQELKQLVVQGYGKNLLTLPQVVSMFSVESTKELEKKLEYFTDQAIKIQEANSQSGFERQQELEERKIRLQGEIDAQLNSQHDQYEKGMLNIEMQKVQTMEAIEKTRLQIEAKKTENNLQLGLLTTNSTRDIELKYLDSQDRNAAVDQQIKIYQLQLQEMQAKLAALESEKQRMQDHVEHKDKIRIDEKSVKQKNKEKINR